MASASPQPKPSARRLDSLALLIGLTSADSGLSRRGMHALLRLRQRQLAIKEGSRGAFVKIEPNAAPPLLDLGAIGRDSPLTGDFYSLVVLQLISDFPERGDDLRALLVARRDGLDESELAAALWRDDGGDVLQAAAEKHRLDVHLLAGTLWVALKPLYESVAAAYARHADLPPGGEDCPVCGGPPWARCEGRLRCAVCETMWDVEAPGRSFLAAEGPQAKGVTRLYDAATVARMTDIESALLAHAFDSGPLIELLQLLDRPL